MFRGVVLSFGFILGLVGILSCADGGFSMTFVDFGWFFLGILGF